MKKTFGNIAVAIIVLLGFVLSLSSCYETHYYHRYNHHTQGWYEHRHMPPPAGVNFEINVYDRHHRH